MFSSKVGSVEVLVDYEKVSQEADPVQHLIDRAVSEVMLQKKYSDEERRFLQKDARLRESARKGWLKVRSRATSVPFDRYKSEKKGAEFHAPPTQYRMKLYYDRPGTRGFLEREV